MAARKHGRILSSIWDDDDFRALEPGPQRMYMFLLSQPDLEQSGVIPLRERRWARSAAGLKTGDVNADLQVLQSANFVVIDEDTEELLVRSLIRRDNVWKQPNVFKSAADQMLSVSSHKIKAALHEELSRLELEEANGEVQRLRDLLVDHLEPFAKGSGNPSGTPGGTPRGDQAQGPALPPGKGNGNGRVVKGSPSPFPIPPPGAPRAQARSTLLGNSLLDEHLKACQMKPPRDVQRRTGEQIDRLLDEGIEPDRIRAGLALMRSKPRTGPGLLPDLVHEAATVTMLRPTGTDSRYSPQSGSRIPSGIKYSSDPKDVFGP
jgi:hypothetical protein